MREGRKMRSYLLFGFFVALCSTGYVSANNVQPPVIVTATRTAQTADETLASATVITQADIARLQARSVEDLLRGVPGLNIVNNGGPGKQTSFFLRGTESDHVLVLIDGVRVGSVTSGTTSFENIPIQQIDRIEIVRGPRSSLYGSEAIGGVIQIFTRKGGGQIKPNFSFGGGSYNSINGSAGLAGGGDRGWFNINMSGIGTRGFNACTGSETAGCFMTEASRVDDQDKDGYRNLASSLRAGYRFNQAFEVDAHFLHSAGDTQFDGGYANRSKLKQQVLGGSIRYSPFSFWQLNLTAGRSFEKLDTYKIERSEQIRRSTFLSQFDSIRDSVFLQNNFSIGNHQLLTAGIDYFNDQVKSTESYLETSRRNWGLFAQHQAAIAAHNLQLSMRWDHNEQFGKWVTGGIGWGYAITQNLRLTANFGNAFKAPNFNELYFPFSGNPNLRPESSRSFEMGITSTTKLGKWSINAYETHINNLITFDIQTFSSINVDRARIQGLESVFNTQILNWTINANFTLLNPENASSPDDKILPRRAKHIFRIDADRQFNHYTLGGTFLAEGKRFDDTENTRLLNGFVRVDLRAEYAFAQNWRLQARLENLFNEHYETAAFFNQPGRNVFFTLRYQT